MNSEKQLKVSAIKNGTVLDHIPSNQLFNVLNVLDLKDYQEPVTFGFNYDSKSMGKKGIIKISERLFREDEINMIALYAPNACMNIIENFEVVQKKILRLPEKVSAIVKCVNPSCITNHEAIETQFTTAKGKNKIKLICRYCEKITEIL